MRYLPHTSDEVKAMLGRIGVASIDALFDPIPGFERLNRPLELEPALDEVALMSHLRELSEKNAAARLTSFAGGGMYDHHIPPAVDQLLLRSEFYTAYTPYQAEVSQGTLQATFEFQTMVAELLGLDVANASMYCGASATAEAVLMSRRLTGRKHVVIGAALQPDYLGATRAYLSGLDDGEEQITVVPVDASGTTDLGALEKAVRPDTAAVVVGYPNFFGCVEPLSDVRRIASAHGALVVSATWEPYALALVKSPGELGIDIAVGEGQSLAISPQFGGPGVGLFACKKEHLRQMPGRLVGETVDAAGKRGYVLTLSTREQHIRRERATSNICTNHGLIALAMAIRTAMLGQRGFREAAELCFSKAEYLKARITEGDSPWSLPYSAPTFNEFVIRHKRTPAREVVDRLTQHGFLAGIDLARFSPTHPNDLLLAITEKHPKPTLDRLSQALRA